jgi:3-methyl-2-oxobutanoate hydroxymethyltransferase
MKSIFSFLEKKKKGEKISMVTSYDAWSAQLIAESYVDCILVGDSTAMVSHGHDSTIPADTELMLPHISAVRRGAPDGFIIGDMPFLSFRKGLEDSMNNVEKIMRAGANAVKLEGWLGNESLIKHIVESGVPVMGHLGLTPQSVHQLGGYKVQGRNEDAAEALLRHAREMEAAGCFAIVFECVPSAVAAEASKSLHIPIIGIGAGKDVDGQVLVLQDLLGLNRNLKPKFVRTFLNGGDLVVEALNSFHNEVRDQSFPAEKESYS